MLVNCDTNRSQDKCGENVKAWRFMKNENFEMNKPIEHRCDKQNEKTGESEDHCDDKKR